MRALLENIFPHHCLLCDLNSKNEKLLCGSCLDSLPHYQSGCKYCALAGAENICGECIVKKPPFDRTLALFNYESPIAEFIWQLKFHGNLFIAQMFAQCWIDFIERFYAFSTLPDIIIPVPLHYNRLKERGFNQALEIAKPIEKYFHIPIDIKSCIRIKNTQAQSNLPANKRKNNVNNAFGLSYSINAKHIAILDDVMTTGNTVSEISHLLKKVGVEKIDIWCCARVSNQYEFHRCH